jgi:molecular chaperone DnaK
MRIADGNIEVVATGGDKNLGGFDWDNKIMEYLNDEYIKQGGVDLLEDPTLTQDLRDKAEIAKKTLSSRAKTNAFLSANGKNANIPLTLETFHEITAKLVKRTGTIMGFVLEDAKMDWNDIDKILLVGGSTRMQAIPELIEKISGKVPSVELHPDEVVTMGAALQGLLLEIERGESSLVEQENFPIVEIKDVNSHSMGVIAVDDAGKPYNSIIMAKNTSIPNETSQQYQTVAENQTELDVQITQGEEEDPEYVEIVGSATATIDPYPKGAPVKVSIGYDMDGMITVQVFDLTAQKQVKEIIVKRQSNLDTTAIKDMREKISNTEVN